MSRGRSGNWEAARRRREVEELNADVLLRTLLAHDVEFVVIGGLALPAHGLVRATRDLDIVPRPDRENRARLLAALKTVDARPIDTDDFRPEELPVPFGPEGLEHGGNWALSTTAGRIDVLQWVAGVEGYDHLRANALAVPVPDVGTVFFAGYDDLVSMKRAAGRPQDLLDIEALTELRR